MHFVGNNRKQNGGSKDYTKELVGANSNSRNWKGILISLLVICLVCSLIIIAVVWKKPPKNSNIEQKPFSLEDSIYKSFEPYRFDGYWINGHQFSYLTKEKNIMLFDCKSLNQTIIMSNVTLKPLFGNDFKFYMNSDPSVLLVAFEIDNLYRHSFHARYKIYNTISKMDFDVLPPETFDILVQNALLSPNSRRLAFIYQNNIYLMQKFFDGSKESIQITFDGIENTIYNGISDWIYEEEILLSSNAMWWSPDSSKLAYLKFNDSNVKIFEFPIYNENNPYTTLKKVRYPKPDSKNPITHVYVYNAVIGDTIKLEVPKVVIQLLEEYYIYKITWLNEDSLIIVYLNRKQNTAITVINEATTGEVLMSKVHPSSISDSWLEPSNMLSSSRYSFYFQIWPAEGYQNILAFDTRKGDVQTITSHAFDVTELLKINEKRGEIYYLATNGDPKQRHLFRKKITDIFAEAECLTCNDTKNFGSFKNPSMNVLPLIGENRLYHSASFSSTGDYYVLECLGDRLPITFIKNVENQSSEYVFEANENLKSELEVRILPKKSYFRINLDNQTNLYSDAELLYPPNFAPSDNIYPVLVFVYNGPSTKEVDFRFRIRGFESYLCVNFGVVIAIVDGRGTGGNGEKFTKAIYKQLGKLETQDQIALANALREETYTDNAKFAIWGWSYGGYISAMALFNESSPFRCAISGAPVTDWRFYDSAYTERYLGLYSENRKAYEDSSLIEIAEKTSQYLNRRKLLLIHGTGDDNVHFQHSAVLAKHLRNTKLEFEFEVYPDVQHTPDQEIQRNLYQKMTKFLLNCYNMNYHSYYEQLNYQHLIGDFPNPYYKANEEDKE